MLTLSVAVFTLLTISIGEEFEFKFFRILSCVSDAFYTRDLLIMTHPQVLTGICVVLWLFVTVRTVKRAINGKMFFAPCLGTDLFLKRSKAKQKESTGM